MPMISRFACARCGAEKYVMEHYSFFDGKEFVPLPHPGEEHALEELGQKEANAIEQGRIFYNEYCVCLDCSSIVVRRRLSTQPLWATSGKASVGLWPLIVGVSIFSPVLFLFVRPLSAALLVWLPVVVLIYFEHRWTCRRDERRAMEREELLRSRGERLETKGCSHCGSSGLEEYTDYLMRMGGYDDPDGARLRCPQCDHVKLQFDPRHFEMS